MSASKKRYEVLIGIDYPPNKRVEATNPPTVVDDIPATSIPWLLEQGIIREYVEPAAPKDEDKRTTQPLAKE